MDVDGNIFFSLIVIVYFILHSILASKVVKSKFPPQGFRLFYSIFSLIGLVLILYILFFTVAYQAWQNHFAIKLFGVANMAIGFRIIRKSMAGYNAAQFLGLKPEKYDSLQIRSLNRFVRHPMYFGNFHLFFGFMLFWPMDKAIIFSIISIIYIIIGTQLEERKLNQNFGESYQAYMNSTPMFLPIPNTWSFYKALYK